MSETLGQFEQLIVAAIIALGNEAYGLQVYQKVCELADREMNLGSMYVTLERMQKKGLVRSKVAPGDDQRGGRPRRFYTVLPAGQQVLKEAIDTATRITKQVGRFEQWKPFRPEAFPARKK
jgi:PadR family transcriptional regulator PadR